MRYTTIQNWLDNVYNLWPNGRGAVKDATVEWIDGNLGAKTTMKYPSVYLDGPGARGTMLSIAFANAGQHQDTGAKMITMRHILAHLLFASPLPRAEVR